MKKMIKFVIFFLAIGSVLAGAVFYHWYEVRQARKNPPPPKETTLTFIPGWNLRQVADYLVKMGFASTTEEVFEVTGPPAEIFPLVWPFNNFSSSSIFATKPSGNYEGYLAPETYRVYVYADRPVYFRVISVIERLLEERDKQVVALEQNSIQPEIKDIIKQSSGWNAILTMASLVEEEARTTEDRKMVADILWRRVKAGIPLQLDSTIHYFTGKTGDVFTTAKERQIDSKWNTYKYAGLPWSPICNPSLDSIEAVMDPTKNNYWYFLSDEKGEIHYARTLEEHDRNRAKYLK